MNTHVCASIHHCICLSSPASLSVAIFLPPPTLSSDSTYIIGYVSVYIGTRIVAIMRGPKSKGAIEECHWSKISSGGSILERSICSTIRTTETNWKRNQHFLNVDLNRWGELSRRIETSRAGGEVRKGQSRGEDVNTVSTCIRRGILQRTTITKF